VLQDLELGPVQLRAVAGDEHLVASRRELSGQFAGSADLVVGLPLEATRHAAVERVEDLAPAGVDGRDHESGGVAERVGHQVERRHADHGDPEGLREDLGRGHADPQTGEEAGPDPHAHGRDRVECDPRAPAHLLDRGNELLGVTTARGKVDLGDRRTVASDRDAHTGGRGVESEEVHVSPPRTT